MMKKQFFSQIRQQGISLPVGSTRMGAAIRHTTSKLADCDARQRVLIVVSDGYPQDCDYGEDRSDPTHGIQD